MVCHWVYPAFVLEFVPQTNEVVIGTNEDSMTTTLKANRVNFMSVEDLPEPKRVFAKIRYNHKRAWCTVEKQVKMRLPVHLKNRKEQ